MIASVVEVDNAAAESEVRSNTSLERNRTTVEQRKAERILSPMVGPRLASSRTLRERICSL